MTPAARCQSAIELLGEIETGNSPADTVIGAWSRSHRFAGSRDRAAIQALVYGVLRRRAQLDWWCDRAGMPVSHRARVMAFLTLASPWPDIDVREAFSPGRYGPVGMTEEEVGSCEALRDQRLDHPEQPAHVRHNIPPWLDATLRDVFRDRFDIEMSALMSEAAVDLRVNTLRTARPELLERLASEGVEAIATPLSPIGLRLARRRPLAGLAAARDGLFEPQDEGSQIATLMTGARPGNSVLDLCAGGGGKALGMAAMMENRGRLVLADVDAKRLARSRPRLTRAGVSIDEFVDLQADPTGDAWKHGGFDIVLVDAPCSGSGAWRRSPDAKWRVTRERLDELCAIQAGLLGLAATLVRSGGRIVYVTCSLLPEENGAQVGGFLKQTGHRFRLVPAAADWKGITGRDEPLPSDDLLLTPARHGTDGFYIAVLESVPV